ncbi:large conductance mechanosensitive channel protein MscL [Williamsia sterculiae]|uniref:Large-conductance mechanosensitive channel n=1 Tax=Williamsia sterculiae TaxID=1344003 RepID=A0A1N7DLA3_9NOCA|nr:large conductance mechanosensitive channel protein MscL [Williamsia sterculiae]SIR76616.1 large conductance mechanosensitive channel [Williamsia sterculiae]
MLKGFKEFLLRGNVIDLATAVVVGAAFTAIVKAFTDNIIQPLVNSVGSSNAAAGLGFAIRKSPNFIINGKNSTFVDFGSIITALINFLIVAAVVYFIIVLPFEKLKKLRAQSGDDAEGLTEAELLEEIRDLLAGKDPKAGKPDQPDLDRKPDYTGGDTPGTRNLAAAGVAGGTGSGAASTAGSSAGSTAPPTTFSDQPGSGSSSAVNRPAGSTTDPRGFPPAQGGGYGGPAPQSSGQGAPPQQGRPAGPPPGYPPYQGGQQPGSPNPSGQGGFPQGPGYEGYPPGSAPEGYPPTPPPGSGYRQPPPPQGEHGRHSQ